MSEYSEAPRKVVAKFLETVDFDTIVVITYDRKKDDGRNWWHFSGHPSNWETKELSSFVQVLVNATAEALKVDVNNPAGREIYVEKSLLAKSVYTPSKEDEVNIWAYRFGISLGPRKGKRLWISLYTSLASFTVGISGPKGVGIFLGPIYFGFSYR